MYFIVKVQGNKVVVGDATYGESNIELTKSELLDAVNNGEKCLGVIKSTDSVRFLPIKEVFEQFCQSRGIKYRSGKGVIDVVGTTDKFPCSKSITVDNKQGTRINVYDTRNINALIEML